MILYLENVKIIPGVLRMCRLGESKRRRLVMILEEIADMMTITSDGYDHFW